MSGPSALALRKYQEQFEKRYGKGSLEVRTNNAYQVISTGSARLDRNMGTGGYVLGRLTEMWGPPSGGKTSLSLIAIANAQKAYPDRYTGFIDVEQTFDVDWARTLGVDVDRLHVVTPQTAEDVADIMKDMLASGFYSDITLDSVGAMLPKEEFDKDAGDATVGTIAKIITRMVKIAAVYAPKQDTAVIILNQLRANIGYGADTTTGGGFALKHVTSHKLNVKRASTAYSVGSDTSKVNVGYEMGVRVDKNKFAPEGRNAKFDFYTMATNKYGPVGIDKAQDTLLTAIDEGVVEQAGAWITLPNGERFQGKEATVAYLKSNADQVEEIRAKIIANVADEVKPDEPLTPEEIEAL